ncbi:MBL fold metallo-hydrolase [Desulfosediminicola ganghwensis]|uniref:MBL fold metallo-hydrolase n=1 Tax=Desulfosediminicola ganghwensis TaxID=2569540 RepID=UPI0010AB6FD8|nr:MBL fold metallo-hydrolase [Desulfosediminicola ganghwensis]
MKESTGVYTVDTGYLREGFAASHMVVENGKAAFIDVGTTRSADRLLAALADRGLTATDVLYVIVTHIHLDHAGGAGKLMEMFPRARLVVHPKGARHMVNPEKLMEAAVEVYGQKKFDSLYGEVRPIAKERIIEAGDGFQLDFNGRQLLFIDTPGHARHHFCVWDEKSGGVFTGDAFGLAYPQLQLEGKRPFLICTTSPSAFEAEAMVASIERVMEMKPETLYLTHFGPVAADAQSVECLKKLVVDHAALARDKGGDSSLIIEGLTELLQSAYATYLDGVERDIDLATFLRDDLVLNAQGLAIWFARQKS